MHSGEIKNNNTSINITDIHLCHSFGLSQVAKLAKHELLFHILKAAYLGFIWYSIAPKNRMIIII